MFCQSSCVLSNLTITKQPSAGRSTMRSGHLVSVKLEAVYLVVHLRRIPCIHTERVCNWEIQNCHPCKCTRFLLVLVGSGEAIPTIFSPVIVITSARSFAPGLVFKNYLVRPQLSILLLSSFLNPCLNISTVNVIMSFSCDS